MIAIVDAGLGNIAAIATMLRRLGHPTRVAADPAQLDDASHAILPGVGAFDHGRASLDRTGFVPALEALRDRGQPVLGICLGMQLLTRRSDEGRLPGLGWIAGETLSFALDDAARRRLRIPHMGWNSLEVRAPGPLLTDLPAEHRFYFVHSYRVHCDDPADIAATAWHGHDFVASFRRGNVLGTQFHPEKSHRFGLHLLDRFARWRP